MPVYEYVCDNCGHQFELRQSFQHEPITICPTCGKRAVRKLFSSAGIIFKGSGWYKTDSRKSSGASAETKSNGDTKTDSKTSGEPKADSKTSGDSKTDMKTSGEIKSENKPTPVVETKSSDKAK
ncbi:MAG: FmdB family transcriptional regulator [Chloroflexi bacterium]|nr:FmdB family transcriptional regulator [Chloroflexota bacterium]